jgi:diguanylate cyclase (GGDEF)-like protein
MFTSDLFGALTPQFQLYVTDEQTYFEQMTPFHQHYMPSRQILNYGLDNIEQKAFDLIAPQHGSIIPKPFIEPLISRLRELEVGLFLKLNSTDWALNYSKLEAVYDELIELAMFTITPNQETVEKVQQYLREVIPIQEVVFLNQIEEQCLAWNSGDFSKDIASLLKVRPIHCEDYQKWLSTLEQTPNKEKEGTVSALADFTFDPPHRYFAFINDNNDGVPFGVTFLLFNEEPKFTLLERQFLHRLKKPLSLLLRKGVEAYRYQQQAETLYQQAITDPLTQLNNRYLFQSLSKLRLEEAKRHHTPLTLVEFDLDHFKQINDTYGHDIGDLVLKDFADTLKQNIRETDQLFRIGGEEFVLLMPLTTKEQALEVIERIREKLLNEGGIEYQGQKIPYNFSAGIAQFQDEKEVSELYKRADDNLYEAKNSGRGKSVIS